MLMMCKTTVADRLDFPSQVRQARWLLTWTWMPLEAKAGEMMPNCSWMKVILPKLFNLICETKFIYLNIAYGERYGLNK